MVVGGGIYEMWYGCTLILLIHYGYKMYAVMLLFDWGVHANLICHRGMVHMQIELTLCVMSFLPLHL